MATHNDANKIRNTTVIVLGMLLIIFNIYLFSLECCAKEYDTYLSEEIQSVCIKYGAEYYIGAELLMALCERESSGRQYAKSSTGTCLGLMQINPKWHKDRMNKLGIAEADIYDIDANIHLAADYLAELLAEYDVFSWALDKYNGNSKADSNLKNGITSKYAGWVLERAEEI